MGFIDRARKILNENILSDYFLSFGKSNMLKDLRNISSGNIKVTVPKTSKDTNQTIRQPLISNELNNDVRKAMDIEKSEELRQLIKKTTYTLKERSELIRELKKLRANDIVETILDVIIDDGLLSNNSQELFTVKYKGEALKEEIENEMNKFKKKFRLEEFIMDIIEDALTIGEYFTPIEFEDGKGITKILDNANVENLVGVYEGQEKKYFLKKNRDSVDQLDPESHIHFIMSSKKIEVEIKGFNLNEDDYISTKHIKVGKSIIFPIINKLKQSQILELSNLAKELRDILKPTIVQIGVPNDTLPEDVREIMETYENLFRNVFTSLKDSDDLSFNDLLSIVTEIKALPSYGGESKGQLTPQNDIIDKLDTKEREETIRKSIALTVGIPFYYLSLGSETNTSRLEALKTFSRYTRKLNNTQFCLKKGLKELFYLDLKYKKYVVDIEDIEINMREIINVDILDSMEYLVALTTTIKEIMDVLTSISENDNIDIKLNSDKLLEFLNSLLKQFPGADELLVSTNKENNKDKEIENNNPIEKIEKKIDNQYNNNYELLKKIRR